MKNRISIPSYIYKAIMALPVDPALALDYRCELIEFAVAYLFGEAEPMRMSEPATAQLPFLVAMLERSSELSKLRSECVKVRWNRVILSNTQYYSVIQNGDKEQLSKEKSRDNLTNSAKNDNENLNADEREEKKKGNKEKESSPCTPLKEKEINKEKEEEKVSVCTTRTRVMPRPTLSEVNEYILQMGYTFSAEEFIAFYESNGWKVGRNPMRSWKAACRTWQGSKPKNTPQGPLPTGISEQEWNNFNTWRTRHAPDIAIDPQAYLDIKCLSHRKSNVVADMLIAANAAKANDVVAYCKQLAAEPQYYARIWAD